MLKGNYRLDAYNGVVLQKEFTDNEHYNWITIARFTGYNASQNATKFFNTL